MSLSWSFLSLQPRVLRRRVRDGELEPLRRSLRRRELVGHSMIAGPLDGHAEDALAANLGVDLDRSVRARHSGSRRKRAGASVELRAFSFVAITNPLVGEPQFRLTMSVRVGYPALG